MIPVWILPSAEAAACWAPDVLLTGLHHADGILHIITVGMQLAEGAHLKQADVK